MRTVDTLQFGRHTAKMQPGTLCQCSPGDHIPVKLDRIIDIRGELTHNNVNVGDLPGSRLLGVLESQVQECLCDSQFMHARILPQWKYTHCPSEHIVINVTKLVGKTDPFFAGMQLRGG